MQKIFVLVFLFMISLPIAASNNASNKKESFLTQKQEEYFAKNLHVYAYFTQIYTYHKTPDQMAKEYGLSPETNRKYLKALANIGLIKDDKSSPVQFLVKGISRFSANNALSKKVTDTMSEQYYEKAKEDPSNSTITNNGFWLTQKEYLQYRRDMLNLDKKYLITSLKNRKSDNPKAFRVSAHYVIIPKWEPTIFNDVKKDF